MFTASVSLSLASECHVRIQQQQLGLKPPHSRGTDIPPSAGAYGSPGKPRRARKGA